MNITRIIIFTSTLLLTLSCGSSDNRNTQVNTQGGSTSEVFRGEFVFSITDEPAADASAFLGRAMRPTVDYVNRVSDLPKDVPATVLECGIANAFYIPDSLLEANGPAVLMCWELYYQIVTFFYDMFPGDDEFVTFSSLGAYIHILQHEIGHALDDQLNLPVIGNTESAADAIATVLAVEQGFASHAISAAAIFDSTEDGSFAGVHPGGTDRAGDLFCWALGGDPELANIFTDFVEMFAETGRDCVAEYAGQRAAVASWLPRLDSVAARSNTRTIATAGTLSDESISNMREMLRNSSMVQKLGS